MNTATPGSRPTLDDKRQALLAKLLGGNVRPSAHSSGRDVAPRPRGIAPPLSFAQQRLWYLAQLDPDTPVYNMPAALRLSGELDIAAMRASLSEIVRRHEALRTNFAQEGGQATQRIHPEAEPALALTDLSGLPRSQAEEEARRLIRTEARRPFRLDRELPLRVSLVRIALTEHVALLTLHHIVADAWSIGILVNEFATLYAGAVAGCRAVLPPLPVQYADFAHWQRQWLTGEVLEQQLSYWRQQLAGAPALLELPTDHPRPAIKTYNGATHEVSLGERLTEGLERVCRDTDATLYMVLLAAFGVLLSRYSGQHDVPIGTAIANRTRTELESLIGFFVNTLVMRVRVDGSQRFSDLVRSTRDTAVGAYAHQDLPFEQLVEALKPQRNMSYNPLFQVSLVMQNAPGANLQLPGLSIRQEGAESSTAKFDIALRVTAVGGGLVASFEYNSDLFRHETIERMGRHLEVLLEAGAANPSCRVAELPLLAQDERELVLRDWNRSQRDYPRQCVHEAFEAQVRRRPSDVAVADAAGSLTYAQLNARANQLAAHLRERGVAIDQLVGFSLERSTDMVVAMLGILKAGGAYVPLDPDYPGERLAFMVRDAGLRVLVTQESLRRRLPADGLALVLMDRDRAQLDAHPADNLGLRLPLAGLAYVIYTSGSTGRPKGVCISHQSVMRLTYDTDYVSVQPGDTVAQVSNSSFDAATFEIWTSLLHGARLQVIGKDVLLSTSGFAADIRSLGLDVMCLTPAFFNQVVRAVPDAFAGIKHLLLGGESLDPAAVRQLLLHPPRRLTNGYGPTESTTFATTCQVDRLADEALLVPIGRPIANTRIYILDEQLQPVPVGVPGELYIAGDGLGRGYLNQPGLTAQRFVPNPFEPGGSRMYRTGDRARYLPSGDIECLGRLDHQVKLRGFRIELGEIEARLADLPGVREAVVVAREDAAGSKRLVAYVAGLPAGDGAEAQRLRQALAQQLPEYMLPAAFVFLPQLPLTPNGKVDRRALPEPEGRSAGSDYVAPRDAIEAKLAAIWAAALSLEKVGVHDNFYSLGGDSLLSMQVIAHAQSKGLSFSPRQMMEFQTIAELAPVVTVAAPDVAAGEGAVESIPISPRQQWFFDLEVENPHYHNTWAAIATLPDFDPGQMAQALGHLYGVHDALRLRFRSTPQGWVQYISDQPSPPALESVDLSGMSGPEQLRAMEEKGAAVHRSLDLAAGPLLKVVHFRLGDTVPGRLLFVAHHLILDGFALQILQRDLSKLHSQAMKGKPFQLPAKTTSFREWVTHMTAIARSPQLEPEIPYWRHHVVPGLPPLPVDHMDGDDVEASARSVETRLPAARTQQLLNALRAGGASLTDAVTAAISRAFNRWTGRETLLLELAQHGREAFANGLDLTRTVGWFTCNYPVLLRTRPGLDLPTVLRETREQLARVPNGGVGYGLLRYSRGDAALKRELEALPQPQVFFNYLGQMSAGSPPKEEGQQSAPLPRKHYGPHRCATHTRTWLIYCKARMAGHELVLQWEYTQNRHRRSTIEALAGDCLDGLVQLTSATGSL